MVKNRVIAVGSASFAHCDIQVRPCLGGRNSGKTPSNVIIEQPRSISLSTIAVMPFESKVLSGLVAAQMTYSVGHIEMA